MFAKSFLVGLLAVSLLAQSLPMTVCRCGLAKATATPAEHDPSTASACPLCAARAEKADVGGKNVLGDQERVFAAPCCGSDSSCDCCAAKAKARASVTTPVESAPDRPVALAILPTDPMQDLIGATSNGATLTAVPDVPPGRPIRILLGVWRN